MFIIFYTDSKGNCLESFTETILEANRIVEQLKKEKCSKISVENCCEDKVVQNLFSEVEG